MRSSQPNDDWPSYRPQFIRDSALRRALEWAAAVGGILIIVCICMVVLSGTVWLIWQVLHMH